MIKFLGSEEIATLNNVYHGSFQRQVVFWYMVHLNLLPALHFYSQMFVFTVKLYHTTVENHPISQICTRSTESDFLASLSILVKKRGLIILGNTNIYIILIYKRIVVMKEKLKTRRIDNISKSRF